MIPSRPPARLAIDRRGVALSREARVVLVGGMAGIACRAVTLDMLITLKRAANRPKDLEAIAELEALREERR